MDEQPDDIFLVRESALIDYLFFSIFFIIFAASLALMIAGHQSSLYSYRYVLSLTLLPSLVYLSKAIKNKIIIEINAKGIFYFGNSVTSWQNFESAYVTEEEVVGSISDNFRLMVQYYIPEKGGSYVMKINMSSTQDKSEEQIIAAIQEFSDKYRQAT